jgi:uncharacterized membrane protein YebE (DUF533 family)
MIDGKSLLDQFLGGGGAGAAGGLGGLGDLARDKLQQAGPFGSFGAGAAAGGLLGLLLGGKKLHKMAGGVAGYGGAAVVGALAYRAFQAWQQGQTTAGAPAAPTAPAAAPAAETHFLPPMPATPDAPSFELSVVRAMIGAAKADGHIDADEQRKIFDHVERLDLDAASKALVFDALAKPVDLAEVAAAARTPEQRAELYVACRMVIDPDEPAERSYMEALAFHLALPKELVAHLEQQVTTALPAA